MDSAQKAFQRWERKGTAVSQQRGEGTAWVYTHWAALHGDQRRLWASGFSISRSCLLSGSEWSRRCSVGLILVKPETARVWPHSSRNKE